MDDGAELTVELVPGKIHVRFRAIFLTDEWVSPETDYQ